MASVSITDYYNDIQKLKNTKNTVNGIISRLNNANYNLEFTSKQIKDIYNVNYDETTLAIRYRHLSERVLKTSNYLKNSVLPSIDLAINTLYKKIQKLEELERK